jgi:hypothetical protein
MHASFGDDHAGKGMTGQNRWTVLPREHTLGRSDRLWQGGQGVLDGRDVQSCRLQARKCCRLHQTSAMSRYLGNRCEWEREHQVPRRRLS